MATINLARSPFLKAALEFIQAHPGCSKRDVILGLNHGVAPATKTASGQSSRITALLHGGLVENRGNGNKYELFAK